MNTDLLEEVAMNKIYNASVPDELTKKSSIKENDDKINYDIVKTILDSHQNLQGEKLSLGTSYFSYLKIEDSSFQWHLLKFIDDKYGMILPSDYLIDYSSASNNNEENGKVIFRKEKEYLLEYHKITLEEFEKEMEDTKEVIPLLDEFKTERDQIFYEYEDTLYMYYESYFWKLTGYSRNDIMEYYQMSLLLLSLSTLINGKYQNSILLKYVYLVEKNCITYLYKEMDLRKKDILSTIDIFKNNLDVITISLDNRKYEDILDLDYCLFRRRKRPKQEDIPVTIFHDDKWSFEGTFRVGLFGKYEKGDLVEFSSISNSHELSEPEKKELLQKVVIEKRQECLEKKDYINKEFLHLFFKDRMNQAENLFLDSNWIDFLKVENINQDILTKESVREYFLVKLKALRNIPIEHLLDSEEWNDFVSYIDYPALKLQVTPLCLTITPLFMVIECNLFGKKENYIITEDYNILEA